MANQKHLLYVVLTLQWIFTIISDKVIIKNSTHVVCAWLCGMDILELAGWNPKTGCPPNIETPLRLVEPWVWWTFVKDMKGAVVCDTEEFCDGIKENADVEDIDELGWEGIGPAVWLSCEKDETVWLYLLRVSGPRWVKALPLDIIDADPSPFTRGGYKLLDDMGKLDPLDKLNPEGDIVDEVGTDPVNVDATLIVDVVDVRNLFWYVAVPEDDLLVPPELIVDESIGYDVEVKTRWMFLSLPVSILFCVMAFRSTW